MNAIDLQTSDHPFLELWRAYAAAMVRFKTGPADGPEFERNEAAMLEADEAIIATPATDAVGALVKLWAAWDGQAIDVARLALEGHQISADKRALRGALDALEAELGAPSSRVERGGMDRIFDLTLDTRVAA